MENNKDNNRLEELKKKAILSLGEWKELVMAYPKLIRNAPEYILDALEYWGVEKYSKFGKTLMRFKALSLSDKPDERLIGHEQVQTRLYQSLKTLCKNNSKMILLVGPNGSAKSTLWNALAYALEAYSKTFEGSRYVIEWVFPYNQELSKPMGFFPLDEEGNIINQPKEETFAFMDDEKLERIRCDSSSNPALLYTPEARKKYFGKSKTRLLEDEELSPQSYMIIKELLQVYKTKKQALTTDDPDDVLKLISRHVRIKRVEISRVYQEGIAVIDPNSDPRAFANKERVPYYMRKPGPEILKNIMEKIPELEGPLSKASNGLLIMEDSLESILSFISQFLNDKRKINIYGERYKIDVLLAGSINPEKLSLIKESPEYNRFVSRIDIIHVPYLLEYSKEAQVYKNKMDILRQDYHIAPHTEEIFALFSVMTRLRPIFANKNYEKEYEENKRLFKLKDKLKNISPLQKAKMYDSLEMPKKTMDGKVITPEEQEIIKENIEIIFNEWTHEEGRTYGISYREVDSIIDRALMESHTGFLSPISLMNRLRYIIKTEGQDYPFLQSKQYGIDHYLKLLEQLEEEYFNIVNLEIRDILELNFLEQIVYSLETYILEGLKVIFSEKSIIKNKGGTDITQTFLESREKIIFGRVLDNKEREKLWFKFAGEYDSSRDKIDNIKEIFNFQIKEAQSRIYSEKRNELSHNLDDMIFFIEHEKLESRTDEEKNKIIESVNKLYKKGYNKYSSLELLGYLKSNLDKLVNK
ncbi:MAG: serine protein kinase [Candidatus Sericytochromatia bacterium]|nr:MAG: serine protein kinase [Candidatus Sericytochromatia bacterium]